MVFFGLYDNKLNVFVFCDCLSDKMTFENIIVSLFFDIYRQNNLSHH